jgi:amino acid adenylation domain-containing protein
MVNQPMEATGNHENSAGLLCPDSVESFIQARDPVPRSWMGQTSHFPRELSVVDFIREKARLQPDAPAVEDHGRVMSFRELDRQSDLVAAELLNRGLRVEEPVVTLTAMSPEFLAGILGILKAGGCYFPIATDTPAKRLEFLLADCRARFALSDATNKEQLKNWSGTTLDLARVLAHPGSADNTPVVPSNPNRVAYLLYTSGSTGQPKGVQIEHHSLTNFVCHYLRHFNLGPEDRSSMLAYIAFDVSVSDIWPVLCAGGTVVIPPKGILSNPDGLIRWLDKQEITLSFVPTGLMEILFTRPWPQQMKLRYLVTGGDRLRGRPPETSFTVINGYGPTESTVFATMAVVKPHDASGRPPPIGIPLDNVTAYVLDENLQLLPVGEPGELYLGGAQLARGYLGRPELTRERFVPDPFSGRPGARMYRTGDHARWLPDGELEFLGRKDDQIQIRGYRVELGEIEALLFAHQSVKQACCVPTVIDGMPTGVLAHVVPTGYDEDLPQSLRDYLSAELPDYMVPSKIVLHERLPLTPQGKADRKAMMAWTEEKKPAPGKTTEDGLEHMLAALWNSLLPAAATSPPEMTFEQLGGDSLMLVKLTLSVQEITGRSLDASAFSADRTFAGLCRTVKAQMAQGEFQPVLALRKHGSRPPLFFLYGLSGDIGMYFDLVEALGDDQPIYGIRSPALDNLSRLPASLEETAAEITGWIRKIQPYGTPAVVGYCWSGRLAFEVARQFAQKEGVHCFTAAIATDAPRRPGSLASRALHFVRYFPSWLRDLMLDSGNRRERIRRLCGMNGHVQNQPVNDLGVQDWSTTPIAQRFLALTNKYRPLPAMDLTIDVFRERDAYDPQPHPARSWDTSHLRNGGWEYWTNGKARIHWLDGTHNTILKPPIATALAQSIRAAHDRYLQHGA